ncbi:hypothetical protein N7499_006219 [Penicillium canescens]|nr:hypothetical protein N7499_006219 [Penicillium canescens]KAJ6176857.1 hypothetical protein N7485_003771 [Penicillium canescens]
MRPPGDSSIETKMDAIQMPPPPRLGILYAPRPITLPRSIGFGMSGSPSLPFLPNGPKRTYHEMSEESDGTTRAVWDQHFHPPRDRPQNQSISLPRFRGDGYDYRRPVRSSNDPEVVDLTRESESPPQSRSVDLTLPSPTQPRTSLRFPQDILHIPQTNAHDVIDVDAEPTSDPAGASSSSPDVQFVGATTRPRPLEPRPYNDIWSHMSRLSGRSEAAERRPTRNWYNRSRWAEEEEFRPMSIGDFLPVGLDYGLTGFPINPSLDAQRPQEGSTRSSSREESYKSPEPAPKGFTRTISDYDVAICPNCHEELGVGEGSKGQIYVSRKCGHVYCGECAENRSKSKAKKSTSQTKPFSKCQIAGCEVSLSSPTALYHLFL